MEPTCSLPAVNKRPAMERCTTQFTCTEHRPTAEHATMVQLCSICPSPCRANSSHGVVCLDRLSPPMVPGCVSQTLRSKSTMAEGSKPRVCPSTRSRAGWCLPASSPAAAPACTLVSEHTAASHGHAVSAAGDALQGAWVQLAPLAPLRGNQAVGSDVLIRTLDTATSDDPVQRAYQPSSDSSMQRAPHPTLTHTHIAFTALSLGSQAQLTLAGAVLSNAEAGAYPAHTCRCCREQRRGRCILGAGWGWLRQRLGPRWPGWVPGAAACWAGSPCLPAPC